MVVNEAVDMTEPIIPLVDILEGVQKVDAVLIVLKKAYFSLPREVM